MNVSRRHRTLTLFYSPTETGWKTYSWTDVSSHTRPIAAGLRALGVEDGARVALLCSTRVEWLFIDLAINTAALLRPPFIHRAPLQTHSILPMTRALSSSLPKMMSRLPNSKNNETTFPHVTHVVNIDGPGSDDGWVIPMADVYAKGEAWIAEEGNDLDAVTDRVQPKTWPL